MHHKEEQLAAFKTLRETSILKRADNRLKSAEYLYQFKVEFASKNDGAHLVVTGALDYVDFWPGTGRWNCRSGAKGFGVRKLVKYVQGTYELKANKEHKDA